MKNKIKVINKGYTITAKSWENDADNYQTKSITVETIQEAKAWKELLDLCYSENNQPKGVIKLGNSLGFSKEQKEIAKNFIIENKHLLFDNDETFEDDDDYYYGFIDLAASILGGSQHYLCRVTDSYEITYSPEDIYLHKITL